MNDLIYDVTANDAFMIVFINFLPAIISGSMANNREIAVAPWVLLSLVLSFIAPILLGWYIKHRIRWPCVVRPLK